MKQKTVLVNLRTKLNKRGVAVRVPAKPKVYKIAQDYGDGRVRTEVGDVWEVTPSGKQEYDYILAEAAER